jgi:hypothetical protein
VLLGQQRAVQSLPAAGQVVGVGALRRRGVLRQGREAGAVVDVQAGRLRRAAHQFNLRNRDCTAVRARANSVRAASVSPASQASVKPSRADWASGFQAGGGALVAQPASISINVSGRIFMAA